MLPLLCSLAGQVVGLEWCGKYFLAPDVLSFGHCREPIRIKTDSTANLVIGTVAGESYRRQANHTGGSVP